MVGSKKIIVTGAGWHIGKTTFSKYLKSYLEQKRLHVNFFESDKYIALLKESLYFKREKVIKAVLNRLIEEFSLLGNGVSIIETWFAQSKDYPKCDIIVYIEGGEEYLQERFDAPKNNLEGLSKKCKYFIKIPRMPNQKIIIETCEKIYGWITSVVTN